MEVHCTADLGPSVEFGIVPLAGVRERAERELNLSKMGKVNLALS